MAGAGQCTRDPRASARLRVHGFSPKFAAVRRPPGLPRFRERRAAGSDQGETPSPETSMLALLALVSAPQAPPSNTAVLVRAALPAAVLEVGALGHFTVHFELAPGAWRSDGLLQLTERIVPASA